MPGVRVGHAQRVGRGWLTGTTVVSIPQGAVPGVDVRGGGPGTRETDALDPRNLVDLVHAVCLTGGSAYGLAAADGVMDVLARRGLGVRVGPGPSDVVPVVPAAVIFDLGRGGDFGNRPDAGFGRRALIAARAITARHVARSAPAPAPSPAGCRAASARRAPASTFGAADDVDVRRSRQCRRRSARGGQRVRRGARSEHRVAVGGRTGSGSAVRVPPTARRSAPSPPSGAAQHDDRRHRHVGPTDQGRGVEAGVRRARRHCSGGPSVTLPVRRRHDLRPGDRRPRDRRRRRHSRRTARAGRPNAA